MACGNPAPFECVETALLFSHSLSVGSGVRLITCTNCVQMLRRISASTLSCKSKFDLAVRAMSTKPTLDVAGVYPPVATPFDSNENIDYAKLEQNFQRWDKMPFRGKVTFFAWDSVLHSRLVLSCIDWWIWLGGLPGACINWLSTDTIRYLSVELY